MLLPHSLATARAEVLRFLLSLRLRQPRSRPSAGFTLVELLVAIIVAALVITPLLGLAVNLLQTDRQENAKATSEQELQAAADFMARDLQQAIYIYDAAALTRNSNINDAVNSGIRDQIPPVAQAVGGCTDANCVPVLVFWKRRSITNAVPFADNTVNCTNASNANNCNDTFVYSLVAYYLIFDQPGPNTVWSRTARISRFEINDGVRFQVSNNNRNAGTLIEEAGVNLSKLRQSPGFAFFNLRLSGATLHGKLNRWQKGPASFTANNAQPMQILVDYIDQSPPNGSGNPPQGLDTEDCPTGNIPNLSPAEPLWTKSPAAGVLPARVNDSFYACINRTDNAARIYLRGNALARIRPVDNPPEYGQRTASFFPTTRVEVRGVGKLVQ